ncbi:MAG: hypothetical protein AB7T06_21250 [Kofleriaceae bacterium]
MRWIELVERVGVALAIEQRDDEHVVGSIIIADHKQKLRIDRVTAFSSEWVQFQAPVTTEKRTLFRDALLYNHRLAIGSLSLVEGVLMLRAAHALDALEVRALDRHVTFLTTEATRLRAIPIPVHDSHMQWVID